MASSIGNLATFIVALMAFMPIASAYDFYVGGKDGTWGQNTSEPYTSWAARNRFQINDKLVFKYKRGEDSVLVVNKEDYDSCNTSNPIRRMDDGGNSTFQLDRSGQFFFISGVRDRCEKGEKMVVTVLSVKHSLAPPPSSLPMPPASSPASSSPISAHPPSMVMPPSSSAPSPSMSMSPSSSHSSSPSSAPSPMVMMPPSSSPSSAPSPMVMMPPSSSPSSAPSPMVMMPPSSSPSLSPPSPSAMMPPGLRGDSVPAPAPAPMAGDSGLASPGGLRGAGAVGLAVIAFMSYFVIHV